MNSFIHSTLRRQRNQRRLTLDDVSAMTSMSPQHLSEIESGKRDPRLSSIERMADAMGLTLLLVPEHMAPDMRRYIATNGRVFVANTNLTAQQSSSQDSAP
jgi:transcriptional regulator with XRE-family HTH domain